MAKYDFSLVIASLLASMWRLAKVVFDLVLWSNDTLLLRNYQLYFQKKSLSYFKLLDHSNAMASFTASSNVKCAQAQTRPASSIGDIAIYRSVDNKKAEEHMHIATFESTNYAAIIPPDTPPSLDQHYETNFNKDAPFPVEETRENAKEEDVDSISQSYQKAQITPTTVGYTAPPVVQTKTKPPPAKTVPSSSGSKSHKSLPRRSCLVYLKEQYHLDVDLLAQPRATKYLVKVRTEISLGQYMAKLELHCSR